MSKNAFMIGSGALLAVIALAARAAVASASGTTPLSGTSSAAAAPGCPVFGRSLSIGESGSDVTALQEYLDAQGYLDVGPTGYFGVLTRAAVARWQAEGGVVGIGGSGSGIFGPRSRAYFSESCSGGPGPSSSMQSLGFSADPSSGPAPLTVQFVARAPQGGTIGNAVDFGDGTSGDLAFVPTCSSCGPMGTVSHTYTATGTYTATLTSGVCTCPANGVCNCPATIVLGTTTVTVSDIAGPNATSGIEQLNAPGSVTLGVDGIAEVRNASFYFTLADVTASAATVDITRVGCWNSFPSDPPPTVVCMIAVVPTPPQTLSVGQDYMFGSDGITLTGISSGTATFSVQ